MIDILMFHEKVVDMAVPTYDKENLVNMIFPPLYLSFSNVSEI